MQGDVNGRDADASMTAFCLIALQESSSICHNTLNSVKSKKKKEEPSNDS